MNAINNTHYSPLPVVHAPSINQETIHSQPLGVPAGHNNGMIDFSPPQRMAASHCSPDTLRNSNAPSSAQGANGELTLNKLVEAIRSILKELIALLQNNQQQGPTDASAQPEQQQAHDSAKPASAPTMTFPATPSAAPKTTEKPFVVQNDFASEQPVAVHKSTVAPSHISLTPQPEPNGATPQKPPIKNEAKLPIVSHPVAPKISAPVIDNPSASPEKVATSAPHLAKGQDVDMSGMVGFAKTANTTGGNGGEVVTVHTVDELQKSMADDKARTVRLGSDLSAESKVTIKFGANKTLVGTDAGHGLHNIYLANDKSAGNDIFQNLNFTHDSRYRENGDMQMFISSGQRYWLDHNTFTGTKDKNPTGLDKLLYVGGTADNVSLTNSKFQNNEYGVILGQPDDSASAKATYAGFPRMTIANNAFNNLDVRAPGLMRHGNFDVYNNYIKDFHLGFTATGDATILSQANYFEKGTDSANKPSNKGVIDDYGDAHFKDIGSNVSFIQKSPTTSWTPSYHRDVKTAEEAKAYDLVNAGAKE